MSSIWQCLLVRRVNIVNIRVFRVTGEFIKAARPSSPVRSSLTSRSGSGHFSGRFLPDIFSGRFLWTFSEQHARPVRSGPVSHLDPHPDIFPDVFFRQFYPDVFSGRFLRMYSSEIFSGRFLLTFSPDVFS